MRVGILNFFSGRSAVLFSLALFGFTTWVFFPSIHNDFIYWFGDDPLYILGNSHVLTGMTLENVRWAFVSMERSTWFPVTWLSHMLDCEIFGLKPMGHHLTSVLVHSANAVLLFLLLRHITGATWRSLVVTLLFAVHPLRVESVAWVAERKDVLSTFFWILSLWMYACYAQESEKGPSKTRTFYVLSLFFFACGLMSKAMVVTLPFVLILLDYWPLNRVAKWKLEIPSDIQGREKITFRTSSFLHLLREKIPFFLMIVPASVITYIAQKSWGYVRTLDAYPLEVRIENIVVSYARYLGKIFWPTNLCHFYGLPSRWSLAIVLMCALLVLGISLVAIILRRRHPYIIIGWLWFLGTLVPVIGAVQLGDQALGNRFVYIPTIGILFSLVWGLHHLTRRWRYASVGWLVVLVLTLSSYVVISRQEIGYFKDGVTLWGHDVEIGEKYGLARYALALSLQEQGRPDDAIKEFKAFLNANPDHAEAQFNLGTLFQKQNRLDEAIEQYAEAVRRHPDFKDARQNLGIALVEKGRSDEAAVHFRYIIERNNDPSAHNDLATILASKGQLDEAIVHFRAAIKGKPDHAAAHSNLGGALMEKGLFDEAIPHLREAVRLNPNDAQARKDLDSLLSVKK